jgi:hypothetical protein
LVIFTHDAPTIKRVDRRYGLSVSLESRWLEVDILIGSGYWHFELWENWAALGLQK